MARERGLHRVPVIDEDHQLVNVISQSQLMRYLHAHLKDMGSIRDKPVSEIVHQHNKVICINEDELAYVAFDKMIDEKVSGLAVLDQNGKIHDNISLRDLKAIQSDGRMFWRLNQTCKNFLQKIRKEHSKEHPSRIVTVTPKDKLETVINLCVEHGIHRIYIVDEQKKPIGVIALKDILLEILTSA